MALLWASEYDGVPPAEAFSATGGFGTPIIVNFNTGIAYYYKAGTGVQAINSPSASGISDHGGLTGLADDDHTQYHTDARGDLRYAAIAHVGAGGSAHAVASSSVAGFLSAADKVKLDALPEWTYEILAADLETASSTPVSSLLAFTPEASAEYIVEGHLLLESSDVLFAASPGISWPSGLTLGAGEIRVPASEGAQVLVNLSFGADGSAEPASTVAVDTPYLAFIQSTFITGGSPSGDFTVTLYKGA